MYVKQFRDRYPDDNPVFSNNYKNLGINVRKNVQLKINLKKYENKFEKI